ncbi:MAG: acyltransferase [Devosia sp.]
MASILWQPTEHCGTSASRRKTENHILPGYAVGTPRIAAIDGLRALAILAVLGCHGLGNILPGGFFGVDVFFVISGFVITRSLASEWDRTGLVRPGTFFGRRVLRLWPAFGAMLLAVLTLAIASDSTGYRWSVLVAALSISNWARAFADWDGGLLGHTWSLSAKEQFYLIWPALLVLTGALAHRRGLARALVIAIVAASAWRLLLLVSGASPARLFFGLDTHCEGLLIGCLLAIARPAWVGPEVTCHWWIPAAALVGLSLTQHTESALTLSLELLLAPLCAGWILLAAVDGARGLSALTSRPALWLGTRSYSIYLWHLPIFALIGVLGQSVLLSLPLELGITFAIAELSYRLLERPFQVRRSREAVHPPASLHAPQNIGSS